MDEDAIKASFLLRQARMRADQNNEILYTATARAQAYKAENEKLRQQNDALRKLIKATQEEHDYLSKQIPSLDSTYQHYMKSISFAQLDKVKMITQIDEYRESQEAEEKKCYDHLRRYEEYYDAQKAQLISESVNYQFIRQKKAKLLNVKINYKMKKQQTKEVERMIRQRRAIRKRIFQQQIVRLAQITVHTKLLTTEKELMKVFFKNSMKLQEIASTGNLPKTTVVKRSAGKDASNVNGNTWSNVLVHTKRQKQEDKEMNAVKSTPEPPTKAPANEGFKFLIESAKAIPRSFLEAPSQKFEPQKSKLHVPDVVKPKTPEKDLQQRKVSGKLSRESFGFLMGATVGFGGLNRSFDHAEKKTKLKAGIETADGFRLPNVSRGLLNRSFLTPLSQGSRKGTTVASQELSQETQPLVKDVERQDSSQRSVDHENEANGVSQERKSLGFGGVLNRSMREHTFENNIANKNRLARCYETQTSQLTGTVTEFSEDEEPQPSGSTDQAFVFKPFDSQQLQDNVSQNTSFVQYNDNNPTSPACEIPDWLVRSPPSDHDELRMEDADDNTFFAFGNSRRDLFG